MAVTAQTESNNTLNVFWVHGRVPMFTFDMNMKSIIFAHIGVISRLYLIVCMYISYKAHNRFTKETLLIVSDVDVYMFPVLRSIPSCTTDMNLRSCILNRHKMRQSQIATIQEPSQNATVTNCDNSGSKLTIFGSDNGLSPGRRQAIIWTNAGIMLIRTLGTNFSWILTEILTFAFKKMRLKSSSANWRPSCLGLNVLILQSQALSNYSVIR